MEIIRGKQFDEERALYGKRGIRLIDCRFDGPADGESALKECADVTAEHCYFNLRYPFWHDDGAVLRDVETTALCRAALWYSNDIEMENCRLHGIKALRECHGISMEHCDVISPEFGWSSTGIRMQDCTVESEYFMLRARNLHFDELHMKGKYSFQYIEDAVFEHCVLDTKDALWHARRVILRNCTVKGEYLAWYCENVTFDHCRIIGTQPLCYCRGLRLIDCEMIDTDLSFERSEVEATLTAPILSIKNPLAGHISVPAVGEIIRDDDTFRGDVIVTGRGTKGGYAMSFDFKTIDKQDRPLPFWSWNERLCADETRRQVDVMEAAGIGGFFMHARGGLQTPYMGEEWFENVSAAIDRAEDLGMHAWAYDENGWPSGFGNGLVNGRGEAYWQKYLRVQSADADRSHIPENRIICVTETSCFYYEVNPFYVDTMSREVVTAFLHDIYLPYCERYGTRLDGFFTDEPQLSRNGIPWSLTLPEEYRRAYGEPIEAILPALFSDDVPDHARARVRFWRLVTELFSENYFHQIYDFCHAHGVRLTGHLVKEDFLPDQITTNGACMPHYEYFDIPGMDWLCRPVKPVLTIRQLTSAAAQTGKAKVLTEAYAACGHGIGHDELRRNFEWMAVRGVNLLCQHLEGYSLRGIRKRDYPPALFEQQPWWGKYRVFNDTVSRIGRLLSEGEDCSDTLLLHNITSAWACFNGAPNPAVSRLNAALLSDMNALEEKHVQFHFGDEILLERHGRVEGDRLIVGKMSYRRIVLCEHCCLLDNTRRLLEEFRRGGGQIFDRADDVPAEHTVDRREISYLRRAYPDFTLHYFVNTGDNEITADISVGSFSVDAETGERLPFSVGKHSFPPRSSLLVIDDGTACAPPQACVVPSPLPTDGAWELIQATENALTLDRCTYFFDGQLQQSEGDILNIGNRALALERPVRILCRFRVFAEEVPSKLSLVCETPQSFTVRVNGATIDTATDQGFFCDRAFRRLDISGQMRRGENIIETETLFSQSPEVYENLRRARQFESEKNKLTFDHEIEALYLVGHFGVRCDGTFKKSTHASSVFDGRFVLTAPPRALTLTHIERQGFPFFAGELTLRRTYPAEAGGEHPSFRFNKAGINVVRLSLNGKPIGTRLWEPYVFDLSDGWNRSGENTVEVTLVNNLRNLLGPHHNAEGESYAVSPPSFFEEGCIWNGFRPGAYVPTYNFIETSLVREEDD